MIANDSKSYLGYLNQLADQYNNTYHHPIGKRSVDVDYSVLTKKFELSHKVHKLVIESGLLSVRYF